MSDLIVIWVLNHLGNLLWKVVVFCCCFFTISLKLMAYQRLVLYMSSIVCMAKLGVSQGRISRPNLIIQASITRLTPVQW